jgi:AmmeMemoRadiSam system protein B
MLRPAHYAGTWYPGDATDLRESIAGYLARVPPLTLPGRPLALVSPHAGHRFSGPVAMYAYAQLKGQPVQRVVMMGPLHRPILGALFSDFIVPAESAYLTPLGQVPVDQDFINQLNARVALKSVRRDEEHSLEIELPFLQTVLSGFTLVPIMIGADIANPGVPARLDALAAALAELTDDHTLFVCSTDLSHLHNYDQVRSVDQHLLALVDAFDVDALARALAGGDVMACGATALVTALRAAKLRGATGARVLAYQNSGDISGDKRPGAYTVGYMAAVAYG